MLTNNMSIQKYPRDLITREKHKSQHLDWSRVEVRIECEPMEIAIIPLSLTLP